MNRMFSRLYESRDSNEQYNILQNNRTPYVVETYNPKFYEPGVMLFFTGDQVDQLGHVEIGETSIPFKCFDLFNPIIFTNPEALKIVSDDDSDISICRVCVLLPLQICEVILYYPYSDLCIDYHKGVLCRNNDFPTFSDILSCMNPSLMLQAMLEARGIECLIEFLSATNVIDSDSD